MIPDRKELPPTTLSIGPIPIKRPIAPVSLKGDKHLEKPRIRVNGAEIKPRIKTKVARDLTQLISVTSEMIGQGGCSCVYLGSLHDKRVAIKALRVTVDDRSKWERRLRRELAVLSSLSHPNVTPLHGVATTPFSVLPGIVTPWYNNGSVDKYLPKHSPSIVQRIKMCTDIANGLQYLHGLQTSHGDLKPGNVLIDDDGNARLCDFGLSSLLGEEAGTGFTTTTEYVGTPRYAAPEIFNRPINAVGYMPTPESDIFSFGCVVYEITTGNTPYPMLKNSIRLGTQILARMMKKRPPAVPSDDLDQHLSDYAPPIWGILDRCWNFNPVSRPLASNMFIDLTDIHNKVELVL